MKHASKLRWKLNEQHGNLDRGWTWAKLGRSGNALLRLAHQAYRVRKPPQRWQGHLERPVGIQRFNRKDKTWNCYRQPVVFSGLWQSNPLQFLGDTDTCLPVDSETPNAYGDRLRSQCKANAKPMQSQWSNIAALLARFTLGPTVVLAIVR